MTAAKALALVMEARAANKTPDLSGADLSGADLRGGDFRGADLRGADLRGADLRGADLDKANLSKADLSRADLSYATLWRADLSFATLRGADFSRADLSIANLSRAKLGGADLGEAKLWQANLEECQGPILYAQGGSGYRIEVVLTPEREIHIRSGPMLFTSWEAARKHWRNHHDEDDLEAVNEALDFLERRMTRLGWLKKVKLS